MNWAEEKALEFYERKPGERPKPPTTYYNSKKLNSQNKEGDLFHDIQLNEDAHFKNDVNTSFSSVHVPTSIYEMSQCSNYTIPRYFITSRFLP